MTAKMLFEIPCNKLLVLETAKHQSGFFHPKEMCSYHIHKKFQHLAREKRAQFVFSCPDRVWDSSIPTPVTHSLPTRTFYFLTYRVTLEPCDLWDIWSEWLWDMSWPKEISWQRQIQRQRQWQTQIHLENTFKEWS